MRSTCAGCSLSTNRKISDKHMHVLTRVLPMTLSTDAIELSRNYGCEFAITEQLLKTAQMVYFCTFVQSFTQFTKSLPCSLPQQFILVFISSTNLEFYGFLTSLNPLSQTLDLTHHLHIRPIHFSSQVYFIRFTYVPTTSRPFASLYPQLNTHIHSVPHLLKSHIFKPGPSTHTKISLPQHQRHFSSVSYQSEFLIFPSLSLSKAQFCFA